MSRILGTVLAGGRSSRFGSDKAFALLQGRPLIEHVVAALKPHVDAIAVTGRRHPDLTSLVDRPGPDLGPLGGLNAALHYALDQGFGVVLTVGCDMPNLRADVLDTLRGHEPAVLAGQPVVGRWPAALARRLDGFLATTSDRSIRAWMRVAGACEIAFAGAIANVNTTADLERLAAERR